MEPDTRYEPNDIRYWLAISDAHIQALEPEPEPEETAKYNLMDFIEAGRFWSKEDHSKTKKAWGDLTIPQKMASCTFQSGCYKYYKKPGGGVGKSPIYCNLCVKCMDKNAQKIKDKIVMIDSYAKEELPEGQWRKKTISDETKGQSLKKRISRNQNGRHIEIACSETANDIYTYVVDEPGKDMDKIYGEAVSLDDIDHKAVYEINRSTGKKMSTGGAFKSNNPLKKEDTIRVMIPQIIIEDKKREGDLENLLQRTNYLHYAATPEEAKQYYDWQLRYILEELEKENIKVLAIDPKFFNFEAKTLMIDWNRNVSHWLSILASYNSEEEAKTDILTKRLYHKVIGEREKLIN